MERYLARQTARQKARQAAKPLQVAVTSLLEWRLAARWAGYRWDEFLALPGNFRWDDPAATDCKAWVLESYRIAQALEAMRGEP